RHRSFHSRPQFPKPASPMERRRRQPLEDEAKPEGALLELQQTRRPREGVGRSHVAAPGLMSADLLPRGKGRRENEILCNSASFASSAVNSWLANRIERRRDARLLEGWRNDERNRV